MSMCSYCMFMYFYCYVYVLLLYVYVFLLLYLCTLTVCLCIFIVPTDTLLLPWLRFFRVFSSVVKQMPGWNPQIWGSACTLLNCCVILCTVRFVSFYVLRVCKCVLYYCHRVATQLQLTNISYQWRKRKWSCVCLQTALQSNLLGFSAVLEQEFVLHLHVKGNLQQIRPCPSHKDVYGEYSYFATCSLLRH